MLRRKNDFNDGVMSRPQDLIFFISKRRN